MLHLTAYAFNFNIIHYTCFICMSTIWKHDKEAPFHANHNYKIFLILNSTLEICRMVTFSDRELIYKCYLTNKMCYI